MIPTITIQDAAKILGYKDLRSLEKWAGKNGVKIFADDTGRKKYLIRSDFEHMRLKNVILYFKLKYKEQWMEAFKVYGSMNLLDVIQMEENRICRPLKEPNPKGKHEKQFLNDIGLDF